MGKEDCFKSFKQAKIIPVSNKWKLLGHKRYMKRVDSRTVQNMVGCMDEWIQEKLNKATDELMHW